MAKKYYSTKIVGIGGEVSKFTSLVKMLVIFDDSMVLPELRDFSVLHSGNKITDVIKPGDILKIADSESSASATKSTTISRASVISSSSSTTTKMTCLKVAFTSRINPFRSSALATRLQSLKVARRL